MFRCSSLSRACAFTVCLALPAFAAPARPQTQNANAKTLTARTSQTESIAQKPAPTAAAKSSLDKMDKAENRKFNDVPTDSPLYAAVAALQTQGVLTNYPEGYFRGHRPLTYYELGIAVSRTVKDWDGMTLAPDGKTLQSVIVLPRNLSREQAQMLLDAWTALRDDVAASGFGAAKTNLIVRTLQAYVNLLAKSVPATPAPNAPAKPN